LFEDRQVLVHMQQGDSDRDIALPADGPQEAHRCEARCPGVRLGWLDLAQPLPEDPVIAREFGRTPRLRVDDGLPKTSNSITNDEFSGLTTGSQAICRRFTTRLLTPGDANGTHSAQRCVQPIMIVLDDHSVGS
jgi:hypothetical protein